MNTKNRTCATFLSCASPKKTDTVVIDPRMNSGADDTLVIPQEKALVEKNALVKLDNTACPFEYNIRFKQNLLFRFQLEPSWMENISNSKREILT